jgi:hypothetical protein
MFFFADEYERQAEHEAERGGYDGHRWPNTAMPRRARSGDTRRALSAEEPYYTTLQLPLKHWPIPS